MASVVNYFQAKMQGYHSEAADILPLRFPVFRALLWVSISLLSILIVLPSMFLVAWAFFGTDIVGIMTFVPSLTWFYKVLSSAEWRASIIYSMAIAVIVSAAGSAVLANHLFFVRKGSAWLERASYILVLCPVVLPGVIYALALRLFGSAIGLGEPLVLGIGHLVLVLPIQYFIYEAAEEGVPNDMLDAGDTLGASPYRVLFRVYLPAVLGAVRASFLVGFFFSFDEIIIASFVIDSSLVTVPRRLWDEVNRAMDPSPAVISTLLLLVWISAVCVIGLSAALANVANRLNGLRGNRG